MFLFTWWKILGSYEVFICVYSLCIYSEFWYRFWNPVLSVSLLNMTRECMWKPDSRMQQQRRIKEDEDGKHCMDRGEFRRIGENMVVDSLIDNSSLSGDWNNKL